MTRPQFAGLLLLTLVGCERPAPVIVSSSGFVPAGRDSLAYQVVGSGLDTILVLGGGPMLGSRYLREATGDLSREHALLFLELRGRGASPLVHSVESLSLETDVEDLERARTWFKFDSLRVIAHHWGSAVLLKHTLRYPRRLARAAIISPFYVTGQLAFELARFSHDTAFAARHMAARSARTDTTNPRGYCEQFWGMSFSPIEVTDRRVIRQLAPAVCDAPAGRLLAREGMQRQLYLTFGTWDWTDSLPRLVMPLLVMQGKGSEPQERAATVWAELLPEGRFMTLGEAPLFPWIGAEAAFSNALGEFFHGTWPAVATVRRATAVPPSLPGTH